MKPADRKIALAAYKETKQRAGIYAFVCEATGQSWLGSSPNLAKIENRIRFDLGMGKHRNAALQDAWNAHGAEAFRFDEKEVLPDDLSAYALAADLKARLEHWQNALSAPLL